MGVCGLMIVKLLPPRKKQGSDLEPVFIGDFAGGVFHEQRGRQHKKAGHGLFEKFHAARSADFS